MYLISLTLTSAAIRQEEVDIRSSSRCSACESRMDGTGGAKVGSCWCCTCTWGNGRGIDSTACVWCWHAVEELASSRGKRRLLLGDLCCFEFPLVHPTSDAAYTLVSPPKMHGIGDSQTDGGTPAAVDAGSTAAVFGDARKKQGKVVEDACSKKGDGECHVGAEGRVNGSNANNECRQLKDGSRCCDVAPAFVNPKREKERVSDVVDPT